MQDNILPGAFAGIIDCPINEREMKPRQRGLTMVIDKGLGINQIQDMLSQAGQYVDLIKLAFGTSVLYREDRLRGKIELVKSFNIDIYPGGTLFEIAIFEDRVNEFLRYARQLGFTFIEVSEGTLDIAPHERVTLIKKCIDFGFGVVSEVGKKDPTIRMSDLRIKEQIAEDLEAGASKVIIEGRDSGKGVGIYDSKGEVDERELDRVLKGVADLDDIIFEAPMKSQQRELMRRFGFNTSFGNVQPEDVITLECMRRGLRSGSFKVAIERARKQALEV